MESLIDLHLKPELLDRLGLPNIAYPISEEHLTQAVAGNGQLSFELMLYGLQLRSDEAGHNWQILEVAQSRLLGLLDTADERESITAAGDTWWLEVGPVNLNDGLIAVQRAERVLAAIIPRSDGRLRVAVYQPLDAGSIRSLIGLARKPHPEHGVATRENNWEYALDASAGNGQLYAADAGRPYLSYWQYGLGVFSDGGKSPEFRPQANYQPRNVGSVVQEIGLFYSLAPDYEPEAETIWHGETMEDNSQLWNSTTEPKSGTRERFLGCLLGGAVGDALGGAVEFMSRSEILQRFGENGLTDYADAYGGKGKITDDTQMTLYTAEGLLRGQVQGLHKGITSFTSTVAHAYIRWLATQGERNQRVPAHMDGWLHQQRELHNQRAPGMTCLSALRDMEQAGEPAVNDSKGCGGVMRVAPVGLFCWHFTDKSETEKVFEMGADIAALTHGHPSGYLTGGVLAAMIYALADGATLLEALEHAKILLMSHRGHGETLNALDDAVRLSKAGTSHHEAITQLGEGWVAEEALAISLYCALVAESFEQAIVLAVNHDGDSDSTGAITGNILGTMLGVNVIPQRWLKPLELKPVIEAVAEDLWNFKLLAEHKS
ncbi:ADP-ribosylglycohydrolase [Marinobacter sp. LV10R510-11A]|uniref:ADP-ribosylglycohydrolase family protein n=1 Tax=Marinobacter sp. LV10R510-11A TaxID=1415568 RepID=UPI000BBFCFF7|nr:ADP-ribosylglycohydrolase family protein [Marinobacter sp. LV10R510-11A]SOB74903.1 ADP-ribosylglycohydrolase [Marinobacter sp. LV10R510-11A]